MPYIGKSPTGSGVRQRYYYTATGGETSLSGADDNGKTLTFTDGEYVDVYLNGVLLVHGTDYGTGTANTIGSLSALTAGQVAEVVVYDIFSLSKLDNEAVRSRYYKTATGGETSISGTDDDGATITFPANADIEVRLNGITLVQGTDYNTNTANTVGGLAALAASDVVEIVYYQKFVLGDTVSKADGGTFGGNVSVNGDLTVDANGDGRLLVGKSSADNTTPGHRLDASGFMSHVRDSNAVALYNRNTSDGDIVLFRKDDSTVGSIGSENGADLTIGNGDTGLRFSASGDSVRPFNMSTVANRDNAVDLGDSSTRFKDLYLSGGVYLGGTGSANYLDDYERGTFTVTLDAVSGITGTLNTQDCEYIVVGELVHVLGQISFTNTLSETWSSGDYIYLSGLPFNHSSIGSNGSLLGHIGNCHIYSSLGSNVQAIGGVHASATNNKMYLSFPTVVGSPPASVNIYFHATYHRE